MPEITAAGYTSLRNHVASAWSFIALREGSTEHLRLPLSDSRVSIESDGANNPVTVRVDLTGSDSDIDWPLTIDGSALYDVASGGSILGSDTFAPFTFGSDADTLTVRHDVQVPQIV
jgi:hypothetical protein